MSSFQSLLSSFKATHSSTKRSTSKINDEGKEEGGGELIFRTKRQKTSNIHSWKDQENDAILASTSSIPPRNPVTRVILLCPANITTGGPEATHQLCQMLNKVRSGFAWILYCSEVSKGTRIEISKNAGIPVVYSSYDPVVLPLENDCLLTSNDLVIYPEIWTQHLQTFAPNAQKGIWWLSVNNNKGEFFSSSLCSSSSSKNIRHFTQSAYAKDYLLKHDQSIGEDDRCFQLFEYINQSRFKFTSNESEASCSKKTSSRDIDVVYNPIKGKYFTDELISQAKRMKCRIKFQAIEGINGRRLNPSEVATMLQRSKIYIDFGPHPGMDRIPREAALAGCLVITNSEGAAGFQSDVPILPKYKVKDFDAFKIVRLIERCIDEFERCSEEDFEPYRRWIGNQYDIMYQHVQNIIEKITSVKEDKSDKV